MWVAYIVVTGPTKVKSQFSHGFLDGKAGEDAGAGIQVLLGDGAKVEHQRRSNFVACVSHGCRRKSDRAAGSERRSGRRT
jgi:hypothetical protein